MEFDMSERNIDPVLPVELFNRIIDYVAETPIKRDLYSCSLVCSVFSALCRPHIFKRISIRWDEDSYHDNDLRRLAKNLERNPTLKEYIQEITWGIRGDTVKEYNFNNDACLSVLLDLPNLHDLLICPYRGSVDFRASPPDIFSCRSMVERYLSCEKLTSLVLCDLINVPLTIFSCPTLETLELCDVDLIELAPQRLEDIPHHNLPNIRTLKVDHVPKFPVIILHQLTTLENLFIGGLFTTSPDAQLRVSTAIRFENLTSLRSLSGVNWIHILSSATRGDIKAFAALRTLSATLLQNVDESATSIFQHVVSLESLTLHVIHSAHVSLVIPHLTKCISNMHQTLKSLDLDISHDNISQHLISSIDSAFTSQSQHALANLKLNLTFCIFEPSEVFPVTTNGSFIQHAWKTFGSLLLEKRRFPFLQELFIKVIFRIDIALFGEYEDEALNSLVEQPLREIGFFDSANHQIDVMIIPIRIGRESIL